MLLDPCLILYLSMNSSYWLLSQTGPSKMDLFSNSVGICFVFLAKIKDSSKTERRKLFHKLSTYSVFKQS